jgi:hypothetical protein
MFPQGKRMEKNFLPHAPERKLLKAKQARSLQAHGERLFYKRPHGKRTEKNYRNDAHGSNTLKAQQANP